jgi:hypothetical protein
MKKYLIDANLPYYFSLWNAEPFIHLNKKTIQFVMTFTLNCIITK